MNNIFHKQNDTMNTTWIFLFRSNRCFLVNSGYSYVLGGYIKFDHICTCLLKLQRCRVSTGQCHHRNPQCSLTRHQWGDHQWADHQWGDHQWADHQWADHRCTLQRRCHPKCLSRTLLRDPHRVSSILSLFPSNHHHLFSYTEYNNHKA